VANEQNLLKGDDRHKFTLEEASRGGKASGEAKRHKATMLSVLEKMLDEKPIKDNEEGLTNRELATLGLIKGANKGNAENYKLIQSLMEKKEAKDSEREINIVIPAKDVASSFVDINRSIDEREYREYYLEGGRGSTKSSFISEKIIELLQNNPRMCAIALRKVKDTLKDSVYAQLEWAINQLSETYPFIKEEWKLTKSPLEMTNIRTGQVIYFRGADDYGKIKSLKTPQDKYMGIEWFEEFDQFNGMNEVRKINQSLIRGGEDFIQFYSYNTPASSQHFVNIEKIIPKSSRIVHLSDYRNVPIKWLGQPFIDEANFLKEINERLYNNEYLGLATGVGGNVFENVELRKITDEEINNFDYTYQGLDFGYFPDPLAWTKCSYNPSQRTLYIFDEYVVNKMSNADVWEYLKNEKGVTEDDLIIADSSEPKSIGDFKSYGALMKGAEKGPGSVDYSMKWLSSLAKIVIDIDRCPTSAQEFSTYEYQQDKDGNYISGYVDSNNHCIDATRYALNQIWKKKGQ
jgi:PBSX family phage terminase large subunit